MINNIKKILEEVEQEYNRALELHGNFNSYHEGYAVILEELEELWDEIKKRIPSKTELREEAIQLTAMGLKFITLIDGIKNVTPNK